MKKGKMNFVPSWEGVRWVVRLGGGYSVHPKTNRFYPTIGVNHVIEGAGPPFIPSTEARFAVNA